MSHHQIEIHCNFYNRGINLNKLNVDSIIILNLWKILEELAF